MATHTPAGRWKRRVGLSFLLFVVVLGAWLLETTRRAGELAELTPQPLECRKVPGVVGPEDITYDSRRGVAYISANDSRAELQGRLATGALYRWAPGDAVPKRLFDGAGKPFHPHGISLWSDGQGPDRLFVVNHQTRQLHSIEIFNVRDDGLEHVDSLLDPLLISPNDLVAVGRDELYVTNDHARSRGLGQLLDDFLRRARGQIVHVRAKSFRLLADDVAYANGIHIRADGQVLYVSELAEKRLRVYQRMPATGDLQLQRSIALEFAPDNIERADDGRLYVASHPRQISFLRHAFDPVVLSPSAVDRIQLEPTLNIERLYLDPGRELSASSVAAPLPGRLLIGSVFADYFLDCKLP